MPVGMARTGTEIRRTPWRHGARVRHVVLFGEPTKASSWATRDNERRGQAECQRLPEPDAELDTLVSPVLVAALVFIARSGPANTEAVYERALGMELINVLLLRNGVRRVIRSESTRPPKL